MSSKVIMFVDDTKLFKVIKTKGDCEELQKGLFNLRMGVKMVNENQRVQV